MVLILNTQSVEKASNFFLYNMQICPHAQRLSSLFYFYLQKKNMSMSSHWISVSRYSQKHFYDGVFVVFSKWNLLSLGIHQQALFLSSVFVGVASTLARLDTQLPTHFQTQLHTQYTPYFLRSSSLFLCYFPLHSLSNLMVQPANKPTVFFPLLVTFIQLSPTRSHMYIHSYIVTRESGQKHHFLSASSFPWSVSIHSLFDSVTWLTRNQIELLRDTFISFFISKVLNCS